MESIINPDDLTVAVDAELVVPAARFDDPTPMAQPLEAILSELGADVDAALVKAQTAIGSDDATSSVALTTTMGLDRSSGPSEPEA